MTRNMIGCTLLSASLFIWSGCGQGEQEAREPLTLSQRDVAPERTGTGSGTAADFLPEVITDEFNPDVPQQQKIRREGQRGGRLRIRNPANLQHLNTITATGQPERVVINHLSDSLIDQDQETLEHYPEMASHWREADLVKLPGGEIMEGRIIGHDDEQIQFVKGAWRLTYGKFDVAETNEEEGYILLGDALGGERIEGTVTIREHTVEVDQGGRADSAIIYPLDELDTYLVEIGQFSESRPFAKRNCAFEFFIRPGITWHDGKPFTAEDVKFSYETLMNSTVDSAHRRAYFIDVDLCETTNEGTAIKYHYAKPYFQALSHLGGAAGTSYFIPRHVFNPQQFGGDEAAFGQAFNDHPFKDAPIYTGPYRFVRGGAPGQPLVIARNEDYWKSKLPKGAIALWQPKQPYLDEIEWIYYGEAIAAVRDLQLGRIDADFDVEPTTWVQPDTNSEEFKAIMVRALRTGFLYTYIGWNNENPIFRDSQVRRAMAMLIPRPDIATTVHMDMAFPVSGPFYSKGPGYDPSIEPIPYDPQGAQMLLTRNGWLDRDGDGILEKTIDGQVVPFRFDYHIHNARDYHQKIADIIKEAVEQAGIQMSIVKNDWSTFSDIVRDKNFDAVRFAWGTDIEPDPFQIWHSSQIADRGDNFVSYRNERVDEICILIRETFDPQKRWELAEEMHRIVAEEQPVCFLFGFMENYFYHRNLRGVRLYPSAYPHDFTEWWWEK